jgi:hypothetical protein
MEEKTMTNKKNWLGMLVMMLVFGFLAAACEMTNDDLSIVGTWVYDTSNEVFGDKKTLKFESSGKLVISTTSSWMSGTSTEYTWETSDGVLTVDHPYALWPYTAKYKISGKSLTISESSQVSVLFNATYTKQ